MTIKKKRIVVDGAGTVGRRIIDAISKQDDMEVVGFTKTKPDYTAWDLYNKGFPLYTDFPENFQESGMEVSGSLEDMLEKGDLVVCGLPSKTGSKAKEKYKNKKMIFQGGEKDSIAESSFVAGCNYDEARNADSVRVVSCNTTGLSRVLYELNDAFGIDYVFADLIRRGADPHDSKKGPSTQIKPVIKKDGHGHHGDDVKTIIKNLQIKSMAVAVPSSMMHVHSIKVKLTEEANEEDIKDVFSYTPRVSLVKYGCGFESTGDLMNYGNMLASKRGTHDLYEVMIWEDSVRVEDGWVCWYQAIHQESITVPETIDAIRAMFDMAGQEESMIKTDESLGIIRRDEE